MPRRARVPAAVGAILVAAFAIGVFVVLPLWIEWAIGTRFARIPGAAVRIERVRVNPFDLGVELRGVELVDPAAGASLEADRISANFDLRSLFTRAWSLDELALDRPRLELRGPWRAPGARTAAGAGRGRLRLGRLLVTDGTVVLRGALPAGGDVSASGVRLEAGDITDAGNAPGHYEAAVRALAIGSAKAAVPLGGDGNAALELEGTLALPSFASAGEVRLAGLDLEALSPWLGPGLARSAPGAALRFAAHYRYVLGTPSQPAPRVELANGTLEAAVPGRPQPVRVVGIGGSLGAGTAKLGGTLAGAGSASLTLAPGLSGAEPRPDIALGVDGIPAAFLAAYARRWLGRALEAGRISLALRYAEQGGHIEGSVEVHADDLVFAQASGTEPTAAAAEPVDAALALLRDPSGRVDFVVPLNAAARPNAPADAPALGAAPVSGKTPTSEAAGAAETLPELLGPALRERLRALTAAPLETLAGLTDLDAAALGAVEFEPGSAAPSAQGQKSLAAWARVLEQRPAIRLAAGAEVDPAADRRALARQEIELHVTLATAGATLNTEPGPLDFTSSRVQSVLDEFAGQRLKPEQRATIASEFDSGQAKSNPTQRAAYYKAIFDALVANADIKPEALARLGRYRAQSIEDALAKLGVAKSRIETAGGPSAQPAAAARSGAVAVPLEPRLSPSEGGTGPGGSPQGA